MDWLGDYTVRAVWVSLTTAALLMLMLAYYSTGAPAARHRLHRVTSEQILRLNEGEVTRGQVAAAGAIGMLRSLASFNPWQASDDGRVGWARGITQTATEEDDARQAVHRLLGAAVGDPVAASRLQAREAAFIAEVVSEKDLQSASDLMGLHLHFHAQDKARRRHLMTHIRASVDITTIGPLCLRGLDFIGRGTSFGLLLGVLAKYSADSIVEVGTLAGITSLLGAAFGATVFLGHLLQFLPALRTSDDGGLDRVDRFRTRHPFLLAAAFVAGIAAVLPLPQVVAAAASVVFSPS